jgi:hypothetical protein
LRLIVILKRALFALKDLGEPRDAARFFARRKNRAFWLAS